MNLFSAFIRQNNKCAFLLPVVERPIAIDVSDACLSAAYSIANTAF